MKLFRHPDPLELEEALIAIVAGRRGPLEPLLVLAPTSGVCRRLRRRMAERLGSLLGIEILTHFTLARRLLGAAKIPLRLVSSAVQATLVRNVASGQDPISLLLKTRPDTASYLAASFNQLREALVTPDDLDRAGANPDYRRLFAAYEQEILKLAEHGLSDRPGIMRRAARAASSFVKARTVVQYGAYELVGMNRELLMALTEGRTIHLLAPVDEKAPAYAYARRGVEALVDETRTTDSGRGPRRSFVKLACRLHQDALPLAPPFEGSLTLTETHDHLAELVLAARRILALTARGVSQDEIALVARTVDPYLPLAREVFRDHGLSLEVSRPGPIAADPERAGIAALLGLLSEKTLPVAALLRLAGCPRWQGDLSPVELESRCRRKLVIEGAPSLARALPQARRLFKALDSDRLRWHSAITPAERSSLLEQSIERWLSITEATTREALRPLVELDALVPNLSPREATRLLLGHLRSLPCRSRQGIAFLDMMQLRGLTFPHLFLIGANSDLIPAGSSDDPFLPREVRTRLPGLSSGDDRLEEERLLFAMTLAAAVEGFHASWQRTAANGSARFPSDELRPLPGRRRSLPTHSGAAAEFFLTETGLASIQDALLLSSTKDRLLTASRPSLRGAVEMAAALRRHETLPFDGMVSPGKLPPISVSAVSDLGRCPLAFFFRHRLALRPKPDHLGALDLPKDRLGATIHEVARSLLSEAESAGCAGRLPPLLDRLLEPYRGLFPSSDLFDSFRKRLTSCLSEQFDREEQRMSSEPLVIEAVEKPVAGSVGSLDLRARFDRVARLGDGSLVITDYKTGGRLGDKLKEKRWLRGLDLQAPLYLLLSKALDAESSGKQATGGAAFELLGLGPRFSEGPIPPSPLAVVEGDVLTGETLDGFLHMIGIIQGLAEKGRFPFQANSWCGYCDFALACRRNDEGSESRVKGHPDHRPFFALGKTSKSRRNRAKGKGG